MPCIADLNNQAIALLVEKKYDEAECRLLSALNTMALRPIQNRLSHEAFAFSRASVNPVCVAGSSGRPGECGDKEKECPPADHNTCLLYDKAMEIVPPLCRPMDDGETLHPLKIRRNLMYLSAIIFFNLGLVSHLKGARNAGVRDAAYTIALPLYLRSVELIRAVADADQETEDMRLLRLALFNNMAHLNFHYYDVSESRICLALLEDVLSRCLVFGEDHELFNINVIVSEDQERRVAPAA